MNAIDAVLVVVVLLAIWAGFRRGFVAAALQLLVVASSVLLALFSYRFVARLLEAHAPAVGVWAWPLGFLVSWALAHIVLSALRGALVRAVPRRVHEHALNRLLGVLPGFAN